MIIQGIGPPDHEKKKIYSECWNYYLPFNFINHIGYCIAILVDMNPFFLIQKKKTHSFLPLLFLLTSCIFLYMNSIFDPCALLSSHES